MNLSQQRSIISADWQYHLTKDLIQLMKIENTKINPLKGSFTSIFQKLREVLKHNKLKKTYERCLNVQNIQNKMIEAIQFLSLKLIFRVSQYFNLESKLIMNLWMKLQRLDVHWVVRRNQRRNSRLVEFLFKPKLTRNLRLHDHLKS